MVWSLFLLLCVSSSCAQESMCDRIIIATRPPFVEETEFNSGLSGIEPVGWSAFDFSTSATPWNNHCFPSSFIFFFLYIFFSLRKKNPLTTFHHNLSLSLSTHVAACYSMQTFLLTLKWFCFWFRCWTFYFFPDNEKEVKFWTLKLQTKGSFDLHWIMIDHVWRHGSGLHRGFSLVFAVLLWADSCKRNLQAARTIFFNPRLVSRFGFRLI